MTENQQRIEWEKTALEKYQLMISKIPLFHREIAKQVVDKKAQENAIGRGSKFVEEADILMAFFSEIPKSLYSMMVRLMDSVGFDYQKYEPK
jgi:hypothetical protein